jgi:cysteinyl-tRNA synthetase
MAWSVCGGSVDVLAGGVDLQFPHHAYQAAMVEAATGVAPFARRQLHVGEVRFQGAKMAKSTKNLVLVGDLLAEHRAAAVRLMLLHRSWREPWEYVESEIAAAEQVLDSLYAAAGKQAGDAEGRDAVVAALLDDLDVPTAVARATDAGGSAARAALDLLKLTGSATAS